MITTMKEKGLETHKWLRNNSREISLDGKSLVIFHCTECGRDFARQPETSDWKAVHVGPFRIDFLPDSANEHWLSEPCPGGPPPMPERE